VNGDVESMKRLLIHITWVLLATASCTGGNGNSPKHGSPSSGPLLEGGTLRVVIPLRIVSAFETLSVWPALDPQTDYWYDSWAVFRCCLLRTLLAHPGLPTEEGGAELRPDLAAGMPEISGDGMTWTFRLKKGIAYAPPLQDTQVVAADIIRALEREAALASPDTYAFYYSVIEGFDAMVRGAVDSISGLEAPDDSTLIVHLTHPAGDLANLFAMAATAPIPPNPSNPSSTLGVAEGLDHYGRYLVATGPYMIEGSEHLDLSVAPKDRAPISGYVPGRSLTLVRNPSWAREMDALRPAYVDRIEFTIGVGIGEAVRMVRSGQADLYLYDVPPPQIPIDVVQRFLDNPGLGVRVEVEPLDRVRYISINLAVPPLDDIHVRRAMSYAIDKQALLDLRGGSIVGDVARHIVIDSLENGLLASYDPYPTSLAKARAEMARSIYDQDGDGRCDHEACRGLLMLSTNQLFPEMDELAASVRRDLRRIGIELRIETVSRNRGYDALADPRAKVPLAIFTASGKDFINASQFFEPLFSSVWARTSHSLVGATSAQLRRWGYDVTSVPSIDDKIDECRPLVGDVQFRCWAEADQLLSEKVIPWIPYVFENHVQLVSDRVVAYSFDQFSDHPALDRIAVSTDAG
jgi:peptide/nickel transport system substrate-binding protein